MKFLIVGLGSMGKRRVRNLQRLGYSDIVGFDPREDRRNEAIERYGIQVIAEWAENATVTADAWIISTPPDTHIDYGFQALDAKAAFFTEANVTDVRMPEMIARLKSASTIGVPSCTFRYFEGPVLIKKLIGDGQSGKPLMFTYQSGQYLPDWHPWESYKDFYVSKRETGACREIVPFELCWLVDIFGDVTTLTCLRGKVSDLDANIDDIYQLLMYFENDLYGHMVVDVVAQPAVRKFRVCGSHGTIEWDHTANQVLLWATGVDHWQTFDLNSGTVEDGYVHAEEPYVNEMTDFVAAVKGEKPWAYSFDDDEAVLNLLRKAERSAIDGVHL